MSTKPITCCPLCDRRLELDSLLDGEGSEERVAAGVDAEAWFWSFRIWCEGCHSALKLWAGTGDEYVASIANSAAAVETLRDRFGAAEAEGILLREVRDVLDSDDGYLLAVPELFVYVKQAFGETLVLRQATIVSLAHPIHIAPDIVDDFEPPALLEPANDVAQSLIASAERREDKPGGWISAQVGQPAVLLGETRLTLRGVWNRTLVFDIPSWTGLIVSPFRSRLRPRLRAPTFLLESPS